MTSTGLKQAKKGFSGPILSQFTAVATGFVDVPESIKPSKSIKGRLIDNNIVDLSLYLISSFYVRLAGRLSLSRPCIGSTVRGRRLIVARREKIVLDTGGSDEEAFIQ